MKRKAKSGRKAAKKVSTKAVEFIDVKIDPIERCFGCLQEGLSFNKTPQILELYHDLLQNLVNNF